MVKINERQASNQNGLVLPVMHIHRLTSEKFFSGKTIDCYITEMDGGRYGVFSTSGINQSFYKVMRNAEELHESFDETL